MTRGETWHALFDLDDTIYPKSAGVMNTVSQRIDDYMVLRMGMDEATTRRLRRRYWQQFGTTMRGLLIDYQIDPDDYLSYVHDFSAAELLSPNKELDQVLECLPWRKVILTNAPRRHAEEVLAALGVAGHFERIFDVKATGYVGKPDASAYRQVLESLGVLATQCIAIDDSIANLRTAKELSMVTVLVGSTERVDGADFVIERVEEVADVAPQIAPRR